MVATAYNAVDVAEELLKNPKCPLAAVDQMVYLFITDLAKYYRALYSKFAWGKHIDLILIPCKCKYKWKL